MSMSRFDQSRLNASLLTTPHQQQGGMTGGLETPTDMPEDATENFTFTNVQLLLQDDPGVAGQYNLENFAQKHF